MQELPPPVVGGAESLYDVEQLRMIALSTRDPVFRDALLDAAATIAYLQTFSPAGPWQPIGSALKTRYIMITDGVCVPDIVIWYRSPEEYTDKFGWRWRAKEEGWFCIEGGKSRLNARARYWAELNTLALTALGKVEVGRG